MPDYEDPNPRHGDHDDGDGEPLAGEGEPHAAATP
jgi:hypothetical protein